MGVAGIARDLAAPGSASSRTQPIPRVARRSSTARRGAVSISPARRPSLPRLRAAPRARRQERAVADWMQNRLRAIGLRPISALVDITNYSPSTAPGLCTSSTRQGRGDLTVRRARAGERCSPSTARPTTSTTEDRIADDDGVELIAGIMGGEHRAATEARDGLIEAALWDAVTSPRPGAGSASSRRSLSFRARRRSGLLRARLDLADPARHRPLRRRAVAHDPLRETPRPRRPIAISLGEVAASSASTLRNLRMARHPGRTRLRGRRLARQQRPRQRRPSWRPDVTVKADLVEQIVRIAGSTACPRAFEATRAGSLRRC